MRKQFAISLLAGFAIGELGWIDPIFIPLVIAGPLATGAVAAARRLALRWPMVTWLVAGIVMLVGDEIVNHEDAAFHAVLALVMAGLVGLGWAAVKLLTRRSLPTAEA